MDIGEIMNTTESNTQVAGRSGGIMEITKGQQVLQFPNSVPPDEQWIYQVAVPFQVSPTEAAIIVNIRLGKTRVVDLEVGSDVIVFDDVNSISPDRALPLNRYRYEEHPRTGEKLMMCPGWASGGFVPLGAKLEDGSPHPHAGTGFGLASLHGYPVSLADKEDTHIDVNSDIHVRVQFLQYAYDGENFSITHQEELGADELVPGTNVLYLGTCSGIPSGEDLLTPMDTGTVSQWDTGLARWRRNENGHWKLAEYTPIAEHTCEAALVRDVDSSLLMLFRPWGSTSKEPNRLHIRRSTDEGKTWTRICDVEPFWQMCPVTINRGLDGRPYVCCNRFREPRQHRFATREMLWLWPLSDDRQSLLDPVVVRDGPGEWGPAPNGSIWRMDHPMGQTLRLADGKWHHLITYRALDDAEMRTDAGAGEHTGTYVEEIISSGTPLPPWKF